MKRLDLIRKKQKELLAEFYSNFALAWFSFGLVAPIYNKIEDVNLFIFGLIISLGAGILLIKLSFDTIKNIWN